MTGSRWSDRAAEALPIGQVRRRLTRGVLLALVVLTGLSTLLSIRFADTLVQERESALLARLVESGLGDPASQEAVSVLRAASVRHFRRGGETGGVIEWGIVESPDDLAWAALTRPGGAPVLLRAAPPALSEAMLATASVRLVIGGAMLAWLAFWAGTIVTRFATRRLDAAAQALVWSRAHDAQTGLPNDVRFLESLPPPAEAETGAVIVIHLAEQPSIGDALGAAAADTVLRALVERVRRSVPTRTRVARTRFDTLSLWTADLGAEEALALARFLLSQVGGAVPVDGFPVLPSLRLGVAVRPDHGAQAADLLAHAGRASRSDEAIESGVGLYDPSYRRDQERRLRMRPRLQHAISHGLIELHYQPKVDAGTGRTIGAEALARWTDETYGVVRPDQFIALAEQSGLIHALTLHVIDVAAAQAVRLREAGLRCPIAVNLSAVSFNRASLVDEIVEIVLRHDLFADALQFEVTETAALQDPRRAAMHLDRLRNVGFRVAMDDFGTGQSSLAQLSSLPFDDVKIDQAFIRPLSADAPHDAPEWRLVAAIIHLARTLGLSIVAEGVEDVAVGQRLGEMGCPCLQGWAYGKAVPAEDFVSRLRQERVMPHSGASEPDQRVVLFSPSLGGSEPWTRSAAPRKP